MTMRLPESRSWIVTPVWATGRGGVHRHGRQMGRVPAKHSENGATALSELCTAADIRSETLACVPNSSSAAMELSMTAVGLSLPG